MLESTSVLGKVLKPSGDEFWVKLTDLTDVVGSAIEGGKPGKKRVGKDYSHADAKSLDRIVHTA